MVVLCPSTGGVTRATIMGGPSDTRHDERGPVLRRRTELRGIGNTTLTWRRDSTTAADGRYPDLELRQLRYFVALAEELHFGRAAAREHIGQSSLSQQLQRLERELDVVLLERTTHHVRLSPAGAVFLIDARQILAHVDRAAISAQRAASSAPSLRVGIVDASYDSMPLILHEVQQLYPELEIHQVEAGVPEQFERLLDGRLDVGIGRATLAPTAVAAELFRLDPLGVLVADGHRFAAMPAVPVARLATEPLLFAEEERAPEFNQFVIELCRSVGFAPTLYRGTVGQHPGLGRPGRCRGDVCSARRPRVCRPWPGWSGGRWWNRRRGIRGRCCGGPVSPPSTSAPSWTAPANSPAGIGWLEPTAPVAGAESPVSRGVLSAVAISHARIGPFRRSTEHGYLEGVVGHPG